MSDAPTSAPASVVQDCSHPSDMGWMLMATVLVLGMFPGLAFFEAGLLRQKNTTTIVAQIFCGLTVLSVMWIMFGFTLSFAPTTGMIGSMSHAFLANTSFHECYPGTPIPTALFAMFQLMFACITPLLMTGAYAERFAWGPFVAFTIAWEILVYYPVAHWMWAPDGWLALFGAYDFAGGIVIHTTAGVSSLVVVVFLGRRHQFEDFHGEFPYSSLTTAAIGATLLWTGWFGFNGGSAFASNSTAVYAVVNSQIGASVTACTVMIITFIKTKKQSTVALLNGAIAGLAGVTPASGFITPLSTFFLSVVLGISSELGVHVLKHTLHIDDALDVSIVHGLTGVLGSIYIGFGASSAVNPGIPDGVFFNSSTGWGLLGRQLLAVVCCGGWAAAVSAGLLTLIQCFMPLRVTLEQEILGLDVTVFQEPAVANANEAEVLQAKRSGAASPYSPQTSRVVSSSPAHDEDEAEEGRAPQSSAHRPSVFAPPQDSTSVPVPGPLSSAKPCESAHRADDDDERATPDHPEDTTVSAAHPSTERKTVPSARAGGDAREMISRQSAAPVQQIEY